MSAEHYNKSVKMEMYLRKVLGITEDMKAANDLKGFYQTIVWYEQGKVKIPPSQWKKQMARYLRYFDRAVIKLSKKHKAFALQKDQVQYEIQNARNSEDVLYVYGRMKSLMPKES